MFRWRHPLDEWEADLDAKSAAIANGWEPPPLLADVATLTLYDGNRRREALLRAGHQEYWTVLFGPSPSRSGCPGASTE